MLCCVGSIESSSARPDPTQAGGGHSNRPVLYGDSTTMETSLTVQVGDPVVVLSLANTVKL